MPEIPVFREEPVSFVRRSGRMSQAQDRAFEELAPRYLIDVQRGLASTSVHAEARMNPTLEYGRDARLFVEIGSGQGHAIISAASSRPDDDFLAIEVFRAGLARTMLDADKAGVRNLRLVEANAPEVLDSYLPEGAASEVWIFFPDP
ncbi:MAG: tRNA (guanosine(46)-N7)-methyltransferase TrmB, partial [Actinomycetota bacterium]